MYRRLGVVSLDALVGHGVFYGASVAQARRCGTARSSSSAPATPEARRPSISPASRLASRSWPAVRRCPQRCPAYLISEIESNDRIVVRTSADIVDGGGDAHLEWIDVADRVSGERDRIPADGLFIFIGTETRTDWLPPEIQRDDHGFVVTGDVVDRDRWPLTRRPQSLEASVPGVFAAGDVRANDVKRVAAAVGEGSISVPTVHRYLDEIRGRS